MREVRATDGSGVNRRAGRHDARPAILFKIARPVFANEDIDAMVARGIVAGRYDTVWNADSDVTFKVQLLLRNDDQQLRGE